MKSFLLCVLCTLACQVLAGDIVRGNLDVQWSSGSADCAASTAPPLQVHRYEAQTYILRQELCTHFEAPFLYLLIGSHKALLIDTGALADPKQMPLAERVLALLRHNGRDALPLVVVHSHGHRDHRAGDEQFGTLASARVVPAEVDAVRAFFGFTQWPTGTAAIDLGGRTIHVLATPGHQVAHLVFYDTRTALLLTGDFLLPGRLLVEDREAYLRSAERVAEFARNRPVSHVLVAHIELNAQGQLLEIGSLHHPQERRLQLSKDAVLALPAALAAFNGTPAVYRDFVIMNR